MSNERITIYTLFTIIVILYFSYMTLQVSLSTKGVELRKIQSDTIALQQFNMDLENHYLETAAYTTINREAREEGYVKAQPLFLR